MNRYGKIILATAIGISVLGASPPGDRKLGITQIKRATELVGQSKYSEAIKYYDRAAANIPQLADWIMIFAASAAAQMGDTAEVAQRLESVDKALAQDWGWRIRARAFEKAGALARAIDHATAATANGTASRRAQAWYRVADLEHANGNPSGQRNALVMAMRTSPGSEAGLDAARALATMKDLTPNEHLQVGRTLLHNNDAKRAVRNLQAALESDQLDEEQLPALKYELARAKYRTGERDEGRALMKDVASDFPTSSSATSALFFLADLAHDDGDVDAAVAMFERAAESSARTNETPRAYMRLGGIAFAHRDFEKASKIFADYVDRYPTGYYHDQATYWLAMSRIALGDSTARDSLRALAKRSAVSYYGVRAAEYLELSLLDGELVPSPQTKPETKRVVRNGLDRWQLLRDVGWENAAAFELARLKQHFKENRTAMYALAEELHTRGAPHLAIATGRELANAGAPWSRRLLKITYPMPYESLIKRESRARGLDPYFVAALIRQESKFDRKAISGAGAVGLMQVMPATGKAVRKKANVKKITMARLTEPEANIKLGTKFLSDLMNMYGKRWDAALVAYNAGPSRAYRWRNFPEFGSEALFIERIPFDETREYVKVIKVNAAVYRALYRDGVTGD